MRFDYGNRMICRIISSFMPIIAIVMVLFVDPANATNDQRMDGSTAHLPSLRGDYFLLNSYEVGRSYHIYVRLPEGYDETKAVRYPVVYLLDGDSTFPMLAPLHLFLHYDDNIPEAIVVGIAYGGFEPSINKRDVDFRLSMKDGSTGGIVQFLSMLEKELLPRIDKKFQTDPERRILVGQSLGGSAVLQAAWLKPRLFWGYVASNPHRDASSGMLFGLDRELPEMQRTGYLIVASGTKDREDARKAGLEWRDQVALRQDLPWDTRFIDIERGTHAANIGDAYRLAMQIMLMSPAQARSVR